MEHGLAIFSCTSGRPFAEKVVKHINDVYKENRGKDKSLADEPDPIKLGEVEHKEFRDGEFYQRIDELARGKDVFLLQNLQSPFTFPKKSLHDNIMELLMLNGVFKLSSVYRTVNVLPYFAYARQDRKVRGREGISSKQFAKLIESSGADRVLTMDLHSGQIQGFFDIIVDNLVAMPLFVKYIQELEIYKKSREDIVLVSPDSGAFVRTQKYANTLYTNIALIAKYRPKPGEAATFGLIGSVENKHVIIIDDMIDSAGTMCRAIEELQKHKPKSILVMTTHSVFSPPAIERLNDLGVPIVGTNTIQQDAKLSWYNEIDVTRMFAEAIYRTHTHKSIGEILDSL